MSQAGFILPDFEHPSLLFRIEDILKDLMGEPILYNGYYNTFGLKGNETVLDFGCGGGTGSKCLAKLLDDGGRLICLDTSAYWTNKARRRLDKYTNIEVITGNIDEAGIPDSFLDIITTIHVIHDIAPADRMPTIKSLSAKLKTGGRFFIKEPVKESHGIPVVELRKIFTRAGLKEIENHITKTKYTGTYIKFA
jgi:ubiquinone/menaquinone biosynthesis C-methylase UbiE